MNAYSFANGLQGDYGMEAIETLLKRMEDDRSDMIVITAADEAIDFVYKNLEKKYENRDESFANAREVRNFFEAAIESQAAQKQLLIFLYIFFSCYHFISSM